MAALYSRKSLQGHVYLVICDQNVRACLVQLSQAPALLSPCPLLQCPQSLSMGRSILSPQLSPYAQVVTQFTD